MRAVIMRDQAVSEQGFDTTFKAVRVRKKVCAACRLAHLGCRTVWFAGGRTAKVLTSTMKRWIMASMPLWVMSYHCEAAQGGMTQHTG